MDTPQTQAPDPRERRWRPVALSAALALAGLSTIVYLSVTGTSHPPAAAPHPAAAAAQAGPATVAAPAGTAASAPPALPVPPRAKARVATWKAGHGGTALSDVSSQLGVASMAGGAARFTEMRRACVQLAAAVTTARSGPPIPAAALEKLYTIALSELAKAAADCQAAITSKLVGDEALVTHENKALLGRARSEFAIGSKDLYRASESIRTLGLG